MYCNIMNSTLYHEVYTGELIFINLSTQRLKRIRNIFNPCIHTPNQNILSVFAMKRKETNYQ